MQLKSKPICWSDLHQMNSTPTYSSVYGKDLRGNMQV